MSCGYRWACSDGWMGWPAPPTPGPPPPGLVAWGPSSDDGTIGGIPGGSPWGKPTGKSLGLPVLDDDPSSTTCSSSSRILSLQMSEFLSSSLLFRFRFTTWNALLSANSSWSSLFGPEVFKLESFSDRGEDRFSDLAGDMDGLLSASGRTGDELGLSLLLGKSSFCPPKWGLSISLMKKFVTRIGGGATGFICTNTISLTNIYWIYLYKYNIITKYIFFRENKNAKWLITQI